MSTAWLWVGLVGIGVSPLLHCAADETTGAPTANGGSPAGGASGGTSLPTTVNAGAGGVAGDGGATVGSPCKPPNTMATVRDFSGFGVNRHPDFESPLVSVSADRDLGLVARDLGSNRQPTYVPTGTTLTTTGKTNFDQWYQDVPGVNFTFQVPLKFEKGMGNVMIFDGQKDFPIDGKGFGNQDAKDRDGVSHNFSFTTEFHTNFSYLGGEVLRFQSDDDLWVFLNGKLAVDLGGLHAAFITLIALDEQAAALGLVKGNVYSFDLFHAERHLQQSTLRFDVPVDRTACP